MIKRTRRLLHSFNNVRFTVVAWALEGISTALSLLPPRAGIAIARGWGWLYSIFPTKDRAALISNLKKVLGFSEEKAQETAHQIFLNFGETLYDFFHPHGIQVDVPDREKLEALRQQHGGFLVLTFHMGNWELGARTMASWGWPVTAVYQPYQNKKLRRVIDKVRAPGVNFVSVGRDAVVGVRQAFKRGDIVAMLGDHIFGEEGVEVKLLGHPVRWPKGPLVLALRENAPIVIAVVIRTGHRHYRAWTDEPIYSHGLGREAIHGLLQEVTNKFGRFLAQHPEQWYRFKPLHIEKEI